MRKKGGPDPKKVRAKDLAQHTLEFWPDLPIIMTSLEAAE